MPDGQHVPGEPPHGSIRVTAREGAAVLVLTGEIDIEVVAAFEGTHQAGGPPVTGIDAGDVTLLSATAVQLLLDVREAAARGGRALVLRRSNAHVDRVLQLLGLTAAFPRTGTG